MPGEGEDEGVVEIVGDRIYSYAVPAFIGGGGSWYSRPIDGDGDVYPASAEMLG